MTPPIHLEGFDLFGALMSWAGEDRAQGRHWTIRLFMRTSYCCQLTWKFGASQLGGLDKVGHTPEEAVRMALDEFAEWEKRHAA